MPHTRIGSELFINRTDSPDALRDLVSKMGSSGLTLIRLFNFWDLCEPSCGEWNWAQFDAVFDAAEENGLMVVPTAFTQTPPGWSRQVKNCQAVADLDEPEFRKASHDYLRRLVSRYATHPALDSWIVWNEASMAVPVNKYTIGIFKDFLREYYHNDISLLNRVYYQQFSDFSEVSIEANPNDQSSPIAIRVQQLDWQRFKVHYLMDKLRELVGIIREIDGEHPIHVNPHQTGQCLFRNGQNIWEEGDLFDFMGSSAHPVHHSGRFRNECITQSVGYFAALMRSATRHPERKFWVSELQGGPAIYSAAVPGCPRPDDIRAWLWESIGRGAEGIVFWTFNGRTHDGEAGEWMLLDQEGEPSRRLRETSSVINFLKEHATVFSGAKPPLPHVKILYSEASMMVADVYSNGHAVNDPRNKDMVADALCGAFSLFDDLGFEIDFIGESRLGEKNALEGTDLLLMPDCLALESGTHEHLLEFAENGGSIIADGLTGWKTPGSFIDRENAPKLEKLFGAILKDIEPTQEDILLQTPNGPVPGWFNETSFRPTEAESLVRWDEERVAVTSYKRPSGALTIRIGTNLFQRYFAFQEAAVRDFIASLIPQNVLPLVRLENPSFDLRLRRLDIKDGSLVILINTADENRTGKLLTPHGTAITALDGQLLEKATEGKTELPVLPHGVRVLQLVNS